MLKLSEVSHNPRPSGLKMLAKFIRRGIRVLIKLERVGDLSVPYQEREA